MKNQLFRIMTVIGTVCFALSTASGFTCIASEEKIPDDITKFFEMSLNEIKTQFNYQGENTIVLNISKEQLQKQLSDLEQQKEEIGNDYVLFSQAYTSLMLEKLHLQELYDAIDPDCIGISTPSAWVQAPDFLTIAEEEDDDTSFCSVTLQFWSNDITIKYNDEILTITPYEATLRTIYFINKYGDKDYFTSINIPAKAQIDIVVLGDATCDYIVDVSDAVLIARFIVEDSEAIMTPQGKANADANYDGDITLDDVTWILRKIVKLD